MTEGRTDLTKFALGLSMMREAQVAVDDETRRSLERASARYFWGAAGIDRKARYAEEVADAARETAPADLPSTFGLANSADTPRGEWRTRGWEWDTW